MLLHDKLDTVSRNETEFKIELEKFKDECAFLEKEADKLTNSLNESMLDNEQQQKNKTKLELLLKEQIEKINELEITNKRLEEEAKSNCIKLEKINKFDDQELDNVTLRPQWDKIRKLGNFEDEMEYLDEKDMSTEQAIQFLLLSQQTKIKKKKKKDKYTIYNEMIKSKFVLIKK